MNDKKMNKKVSLINSIFITLVILIVAIVSLVPLLKNISFGLDLAGGFEVLYKVDSLDGKKVTADMVNSTYKIIEKRVNSLGVSEPEITVEGNNIRVQLAGVTNADEARNNISKVGSLTFRDTSDNLLVISPPTVPFNLLDVSAPNFIPSSRAISYFKLLIASFEPFTTNLFINTSGNIIDKFRKFILKKDSSNYPFLL